MENVINVNIGGVAFTLNSEAYAILEKYLSELSNHYRTQQYGAEIMEDIESRIAELLLEKFSKEEVVNSERIEEVIEIMGKPSDYYAADADEEQSHEKETDNLHRDSFSQNSGTGPVRKRLHRDLENKYLGGVCGGLGRFFNMDPTWIRIAFVLLIIASEFAPRHIMLPPFFDKIGSVLILLYIVFWIFVPGAKTFTQKCEMLGHDPGVKGAEGTKGTSPSNPSSLENVFRWVIGLAMIFIGFGILIYGLVIGLCLATGTLPGTLAEVKLVTDVSGFLPSISSWKVVMLTVSTILIWIIPCILLIYEGIRVIGRFDSPKWHPGLILFILWLLAVIACVASIFYMAKDVDKAEFTSIMRDIDPDCEVIVDTTAAEDYDNTYIIDADSVSVVQQELIQEDSTVVR